MLAFASVGLMTVTSCNDYLTIYPTDRVTGKDFWKTAGDVQETMAAAYAQMISGATEERAIVWSTFRSDEVIQSTSFTNNDFENISAVNLLQTQNVCDWASFYAVINRCNIVLEHAPKVMEIDPEFTQGDYEVVRGNMLALRSLCYFYLVRAFRDVPYTKQAYEDDDEQMVIPQSAPDSVLAFCINDLEEAGHLVMKSGAYGNGNWRNKGYFTRDAVNALLADIYLWRGSMTHNVSDYRQCIAYCDMIIESKDKWFKENNTDQVTVGDANDRYHLYTAENAMREIFVNGNSRESILELQYDGNTNANSTLCNYLYRTSDNSAISRFMASQIFNATSTDANTQSSQKIFFSKNDHRYWDNVFEVENDDYTELNIRKYATITGDNAPTSGNGQNFAQGATRRVANFTQNWMVYRLTDVMLMKAEALVQISQEDESALEQAFNLVQVVNKRSMSTRGNAPTDTLKIGDFQTQGEMENLVLAERGRELSFEGKRWFDLMRYCYRHMEGVDITKLMADQVEWPQLYQPMLAMAARKYTTGGDVFIYKMKSEPYLYWPIYQHDLKVNKLLKQNPVFKLVETSVKQ